MPGILQQGVPQGLGAALKFRGQTGQRRPNPARHLKLNASNEANERDCQHPHHQDVSTRRRERIAPDHEVLHGASCYSGLLFQLQYGKENSGDGHSGRAAKSFPSCTPTES
jgi:hypothetical protein